MEALGRRAERLGRGSFNSQEVSNILNAFGKLGVPGTVGGEGGGSVVGGKERLLRMLFDEARCHVPSMKAQAVSSVLNALTKFPFVDLGLVDDLVAAARRVAPDLNGQGIFNVLNALAAFDVRDPEVLGALCVSARSMARGDFGPQESSGALNALAKLDYYDVEAFRHLCAEALEAATGMTTIGVSNALNALVKVGHEDAKLAAKLLEEAERKADDMSPRSLAVVFNAVARLEDGGTRGGEGLVPALCRAVSARAKEAGFGPTFGNQEVAMILNALARLGHLDLDALDALASSARSTVRPGDAKPQDVAMILNAFAKLERYDRELYGACCDAARGAVRTFTPQELGNTANAISKAKHVDVELFEEMCGAAVGFARSGEFNSINLSNFMNAMSRFDWKDEELIAALCAASRAKISEFSPQDISKTLNAMARLYVTDDVTIRVLCEEAKKKTELFNHQHVVNSLYSLATLSHYDRELFSSTIRHLESFGEDGFCEEDLSQLYMIQLCLNVEQPQWGLSISPSLLSRASDVQDRMLFAAQSSKLHLRVSKALADVGFAHRNECVVGGLSIDILHEAPKGGQGGAKGVIVEVDGPYHYLSLPGRGHRDGNVVGYYKLKERLLEKQGYKVLHVPYMEWDAMSGKEQHKEFLRQLLEGAK